LTIDDISIRPMMTFRYLNRTSCQGWKSKVSPFSTNLNLQNHWYFYLFVNYFVF